MKIHTERQVVKNGVILDMTTLKMSWAERDAGVVEGEKLRIRSDRWREIRTAVVDRAVNLVLDGALPRGTPLWDVIIRSAEEVLDNPRIFTQMNHEARVRFEATVSLLVKRGFQQLARTKAHIQVQATDGTLLGHPRPGMDEINMGDSSTATIDTTEEEVAAAMQRARMERDAAKAGVEVKRKEPKAFPECLCGCGERTKGGRFLPGHDAILKGRLVGEYRTGLETDDEAMAKKAFSRLIDFGWEKYATPGTKKSKAPRSDDGLGGGTYLIHDADTDVLIQRTPDDESALSWIEANGYELIETVDGGIRAKKSDPEEDKDSEDEE